jgi:hypothetical protein
VAINNVVVARIVAAKSRLIMNLALDQIDMLPQ